MTGKMALPETFLGFKGRMACSSVWAGNSGFANTFQKAWAWQALQGSDFPLVKSTWASWPPGLRPTMDQAPSKHGGFVPCVKSRHASGLGAGRERSKQCSKDGEPVGSLSPFFSLSGWGTEAQSKVLA